MSFKKIVSNLSFSPSIVGQLSILSKLNKNEEITRRIGLIFLVLALLIQTIIILRPIESPNSASVTDMITRGYGVDSNSCSELELASHCINGLELSQTAVNLSQGNIPTTSIIQEPGDQINITINIANTTEKDIITKPSVRLSDLLEYSTLIDSSGGTIEPLSNVLSWDTTIINAGSTHTKTYRIKTLDKIPLTAQGKQFTESYDCKMSSIFGNRIDMNINCPLYKSMETLSSLLPEATPNIIIATASVLLIFTTLLYAKTRQLRREIKLIRRDSSAGIL